MFRGPYIHIGADKPRGMPHDLYASYVQLVRSLVRSTGKRPLGWQESARAGLGPDDVVQYWLPPRPATLFIRDRRRVLRLGTRRSARARSGGACRGSRRRDLGRECFLLLPRLAGVAHTAWSDPRVATWTDHRDRLARHGRLWAQDNLTYFRTSTVDWV